MTNEKLQMHQAEATRLKNRIIGTTGEFLYTLSKINPECPISIDEEYIDRYKTLLNERLTALKHHLSVIREERENLCG